MPTVSDSDPTSSSSGSSLAVAGARAPFPMTGACAPFRVVADDPAIVDVVRPCAVATRTGTVSPGANTVSDTIVDLGGSPAAESTQVFMFAIRWAVALSAFARWTAAATAAAESDTLGFGGMNVENCA